MTTVISKIRNDLYVVGVAKVYPGDIMRASKQIL